MSLGWGKIFHNGHSANYITRLISGSLAFACIVSTLDGSSARLHSRRRNYRLNGLGLSTVRVSVRLTSRCADLALASLVAVAFAASWAIFDHRWDAQHSRAQLCDAFGSTALKGILDSGVQSDKIIGASSHDVLRCRRRCRTFVTINDGAEDCGVFVPGAGLAYRIVRRKQHRGPFAKPAQDFPQHSVLSSCCQLLMELLVQFRKQFERSGSHRRGAFRQARYA